MADNTVLPGAGDVVRDIDRGNAKTQVVALDFGGESGPEVLVTIGNPLPVSDVGSTSRITNLLTMQQNLILQSGTQGFIPMETPGFLVGI
jgi:hypothetical protein